MISDQLGEMSQLASNLLAMPSNLQDRFGRTMCLDQCLAFPKRESAGRPPSQRANDRER